MTEEEEEYVLRCSAPAAACDGLEENVSSQVEREIVGLQRQLSSGPLPRPVGELAEL